LRLFFFNNIDILAPREYIFANFAPVF